MSLQTQTGPLCRIDRLQSYIVQLQCNKYGYLYSRTSGTKRLPGTWKTKERRAPRSVKSYQERLKDMKHIHRDYTQPLVPKARTHG